MLSNVDLKKDLRTLCDKFEVKGGISIALISPDGALDIAVGKASDKDTQKELTPLHWLQHASLSKSIAAVFACQYFASKGIPLDTCVNDLFERETTSPFRLKSAAGSPSEWADQVQLRHLVDHSGCGMHYVRGIPLTDEFPSVLSLIAGDQQDRYNYEPIEIFKEPGTKFAYSGGGFLVLQHLLEEICHQPIENIMRPFLNDAGLADFSFTPKNVARANFATGFMDDGTVVGDADNRPGRFAFPPLAAGGQGTPRALANFWAHMVAAYNDPSMTSPISHATAVAVLRDHVRDLGSGNFMNASMGLGVFITQAGPNKVALHQAANEGFRGAYLVCFEGPDAGKGMVVLSNGDNNSALLNAEAMRLLLRRWSWEGIDKTILDRDTDFVFDGIPQEQIVNLAYKALVFDAFVQPTTKMVG